jgi:hypothetical protein
MTALRLADDFESRRQGALDRFLEGGDHAANSREVELDRPRVSVVKRDRAGANHGPAANLGCLEASPA